VHLKSAAVLQQKNFLLLQIFYESNYFFVYV
jgi:hypothetical protein